MVHTHANFTGNSTTVTHTHLANQAAKKCKTIWPSTHAHQQSWTAGNSHNHTNVVLSFANAALGAPWWNHVHAISLVSMDNGGGAHADHPCAGLLGAQCADCPTPADHTHAAGTAAIANGGAAHAHTIIAANTSTADPAGTPDVHTHTFTSAFNVADAHTHAVSGTYGSTVCDGGNSHNHLASTPTITSNHNHNQAGTTAAGGEPGAGISVPVAFHHLKSMNNAHVTDFMRKINVIPKTIYSHYR